MLVGRGVEDRKDFHSQGWAQVKQCTEMWKREGTCRLAPGDMGWLGQLRLESGQLSGLEDSRCWG